MDHETKPKNISQRLDSKNWITLSTANAKHKTLCDVYAKKTCNERIFFSFLVALCQGEEEKIYYLATGNYINTSRIIIFFSGSCRSNLRTIFEMLFGLRMSCAAGWRFFVAIEKFIQKQRLLQCTFASAAFSHYTATDIFLLFISYIWMSKCVHNANRMLSFVLTHLNATETK